MRGIDERLPKRNGKEPEKGGGESEEEGGGKEM